MNKELLDYFGGDELAAPTWLRKYAVEGELTPDDMHKRMAKEFAKVEEKYHKQEADRDGEIPWSALSDYGLERGALGYTQIYDLFKGFKYVVPQGSIMSQLGSPTIGSLSNCFVAGQPYDSYGGIMQKDQELVQLMKRRGGVGLDLSTLRPSGTDTTNAAKTSTGAISFMERYSNSTREVAQNGRRGALMLSIDVRHPDVAEFVTIKNDETKVTGANISVFLRDDFMEKVESEGDYILKFPCEMELLPGELETMETQGLEYNKLYTLTGERGYIRKVKAKELYDKIINAAWLRAEPGQLFMDRFHNYSPDSVYPQYKGVTTNPCSEIFMQPYDACRLMAVNLYSFVENPFTEEAKFDFEKFYKYNYETQRLMDDLVDLELEHIDRIINKINLDPEPMEVKYTELMLWNKIKKVAGSGRRTGTGITALGDTLAALGLSYDSNEGIKVTEEIMSTKLESELDCIIDLAILRAPFEGWERHLEFSRQLDGEITGMNPFYDFIASAFPQQAERMYKYGRRNVSWSTIAPTGTVSLMTQTTSGLEPLFQPFYTRRVKVNQNDPTMRVDFVDKMGDEWMEQAILHPKFKTWMQVNDTLTGYSDAESSNDITEDYLKDCFGSSPWYGSTANDIDWGKRVKIQGIIQKYISHSISSTINLPNDVTEESVKEIYVASWKEGLKGVTVYRDGCRSGVLVVKDQGDEIEFRQLDAPKRPKILDAEISHVTSKGNRYTVIVGLFSDKPYEVFCVEGEQFKHQSKGELKKLARGNYSFEGVNLNLNISDEEVALTRMISTALRHGSKITYIVEQLNKANGTIVSFSKAIARTLKKYIPDGEISTVSCNDCGSTNVIFEEGCSKCLACGSSACG